MTQTDGILLPDRNDSDGWHIVAGQTWLRQMAYCCETDSQSCLGIVSWTQTRLSTRVTHFWRTDTNKHTSVRRTDTNKHTSVRRTDTNKHKCPKDRHQQAQVSQHWPLQIDRGRQNGFQRFSTVANWSRQNGFQRFLVPFHYWKMVRKPENDLKTRNIPENDHTIVVYIWNILVRKPENDHINIWSFSIY